MKLIEKLADDELNGRDFQSCCDRADADRSLYLAGFRKARELSLVVWDTYDGNDGHTYCDFFHEGRVLIENLGEEELPTAAKKA